MTLSAQLIKRRDAQIGIAATLFLWLGSLYGLLPFTQIETWGFITGGWSVWLLVKENIWNWPLSITNTAIYLIVFLEARLFADSGLQLFYTVAALWGWWYWLHGGGGHGARRISRIRLPEAVIVALLVAGATYGLTFYLRSIGDTAPFLDALTTAGSLGAFYMQCRKLLENWFVWIALDCIYIPLYISKALPLTAILYAVFMSMCVVGLRDWYRKFQGFQGSQGFQGFQESLGPRYGHGVVVGKFYPFHTGHQYLIETALAHCDRVTVIVAYRHAQSIPAETRQRWIEELEPDVEVLVLDQDEIGLGDEDSAAWARETVRALGHAPDVVFSSEAYGKPWAKAMGSAHFPVDRKRRTFPISGTKLRDDPQRYFEYLTEPARSLYAKRVCVLGAESSGKTTLARALAAHYKTVWVPEYGAPYTAYVRPALPDWSTWTTEEFLLIARTQNWLEDFQATLANRLLICDTNAYVTARFHEVYLGHQDDELETVAREHSYDLYIVCGMEIPFHQDAWNGRVDGPHRQLMHEDYIRHLEEIGASYIVVSGSHAQRTASAIREVDALLAAPVPALV